MEKDLNMVRVQSATELADQQIHLLISSFVIQLEAVENANKWENTCNFKVKINFHAYLDINTTDFQLLAKESAK